MKKVVAKIIGVLIITCFALSSLVACADSKWQGTVTLKNSGAVIQNGGFIAETENYIYFINGIEQSNADNHMGTPVKGALMVADKSDLSKVEIVVPKLMVASDYNAGVFIDNGYAYYATPNVEKDSEGEIANYQLMLTRTKLDGSGKTDTYFTLDSISTEYRIVKAANDVCIYYYDEDSSAIVCYSTSNKSATTVIKTDEKADEFSLDKYVFLNNSEIEDVVAYCTATVYANSYDDNAEQNPNYQRLKANYNRVYAIKAGNNTPQLVLDGSGEATDADDILYAISLIDDGFVFFTETNKKTTTTKAISLTESYDFANWKSATKIENPDYVVNTNLFISLENAIVLGENKVYKTTLTQKDSITKTPILERAEVNKLLFVNQENGVDYLYYFDDVSQITKIDLSNISINNQEIHITESGVSTTWFTPEIVKTGANQSDTIFYCDSSNAGKSYIKYIDLSSEITEETDDDENTIRRLDVNQIKNLGKMKDADAIAIFNDKISALKDDIKTEGLGLDAGADTEFLAELNKLKSEYNGLSSTVKQGVDKETLENIQKAFEVVEKYKELEGIENCVDAEDAIDLGIKDKYDQVKEYLVNFKNSSSRDNVDQFIANNLKANYTKAVELFESND